MRVGGRPEEVGRVTAAFDAYADRTGVPTEVRRTLLVVLDDLLANVVGHGLAGRANGEATVEVAREECALVVTIADNGPPFDPFARAAPDTSLSVEQRGIGGLGIHLVRRMMDEVQYVRSGDRNITVLTKRWTADQSQGTPRGL